ncbi:16S rRNA (guanine(966)-N(2))-methyltransferase RsmD [Spiroplasma culicicola]|uniref:N6-adenine-specific methylase n=1 Tax=Spiroplasma culicicola AES-1 TaxID=1276246 RepID=W6A8J6_9MOLU|nr:16S rRNA (guanine(966)-N(2))-methyltransferase RsmD [Spiroplasma culicicola]AHI53200.1 N6-adenine-specific methylase [Spiroplasma culicicola AES-1]
MKVISGKYRGRHLKTLEGQNTRPTTARVKEDMFNILNNYFIFENKTSLDLFGGSGALSIEGLSRGIKFAYINDHYKPALEIIKENLYNIDSNEYQLLNLDYGQVLKYLKSNNIYIDLIYLDPPFAQVQYYYDFFNYINDSKILNNYGIVITESESPLDLTQLDFLELLKYKEYKNKHLYVLRNEKEGDQDE